MDDAQRKGLSNRRLEYIGRCLQDKIDLKYALPPETNLPVHLLKGRLLDGKSALSIEDFVRAPERFFNLVKADLNVAFRFAHLLPMMASKELCAVRGVILSLPAEVQMMIVKSFPFVYQQTLQAIARFQDPIQANLFKRALEKSLREAPPGAAGGTSASANGKDDENRTAIQTA